MSLRIPINLASEPFRKNRPILVASIAVGLLEVGLLALLITLGFSDRGRTAEIRRELGRLEKQVETLNREQAGLEGVLRRPENSEVLQRSVFLNVLLYRKGISWTRIFNDLEKVVPSNVRLIAVRPQVDAQNHVVLDMVVGGESSAAVIEMLKRLESSPQFGDTAVHNSMPPSQTDPLFRYRISVNYAQKL